MVKSLFLIALLGVSAPSVGAPPHRLNLFIWSEYIDPGIIADFQKAFDCKVTVDLYEDEFSMQAKLQGGGAALYDVAVPPDHLVSVLVKLKLLAPLRHANLPNLKNLEDRFRQLPYDPGNRFTVAYQWGTVGLYVRQPQGRKLEETWGLIFDPQKQPGPFILMDTCRETLGAALKFNGYSLNSSDRKQLIAARDLVLAAKKRSLGFENGVGGKNRVLAKTAVAAVVYNGDAIRAMAGDPGTRFFVPKEGGEIWVDNLVVLAKAPHRDMAEKFINYLLDPHVGARLANFNQYASPNQAAKSFIRPADLKNPAIYPGPDTVAKLEFLEDLGIQSRLYDEIWTQIKAK